MKKGGRCCVLRDTIVLVDTWLTGYTYRLFTHAGGLLKFMLSKGNRGESWI